MVLEEASTPSEAFTSDAPPSSDIDPYSTQNPPYTSTKTPSYAAVPGAGGQRIYVNMNNLPRPFSLFGERGHPQFLVESIQDSCRFLQRVLKRPPTQEEADAFAFHAAKTYRIASFGSPIGGVLASVQFYRTMDTFRFPGYSPFKEGSRFSVDSLGFLKGQMARYGWHSLRLSSYLLLGTTLGQVFFGSYALSVSLAGRAMDPRLKDFTERLRQMQKEGASVQQMRREQDVDGTTQSETFEQRRQRRAVQGMNRDGGREQSGAAQGYDDMSPTGGAFGSEYNDTSSDTGLMNDSQTISHQVRQQADYRSSPTDSTANTFDLDKAAPQRPATSSQTANQQRPQQSSGGSSWERLRQQAASNGGVQQRQGSSGPQAGQRQGSTGGDSFSFSESDEQRQLAQGEAQRDFDARLDREREGKDFEDRSRGGRKW